ncbi:Similar to Ubiquitin-conjugating enzyme E2 S; acc. no. A7SE05 [Pyronema omphalodes CBS 100304]|uniref:Ubiquitin-conjugating enzyme E2 2 n=1 Tax=Pyronema omphalodes (strain CBS 100304) TaxID=1076935 RepID=U4L5M2_PYROM|nr:Similar to Ubiquitin-conjugating enzyme E2 S; acc. no. A7SE05 [Pyronema omphalodes CBS 100304]
MASNLARRRLARDHAALRESLPPDFFFAGEPSDDLRGVTVHLAGPTSTPYEPGVFAIILRIPDTYPVDPPKANFQTKIYHPNVDMRTGDVCVETLKRDWKPTLTLKDVLSTIRCLLVYPNPDSSLNEEAGKMLQEGYNVFQKHARMMTEVYARVPEELQKLVMETRARRAEDDDEPAPAAPAQAPAAPAAEPMRLQATPARNNAATACATPPRLGSKPRAPVITRRTATGKPRTVMSAGAGQAVLDGHHDDSDDADSGKENAVRRTTRRRSSSGQKRGRDMMDIDIPEGSTAASAALGSEFLEEMRKSPRLEGFDQFMGVSHVKEEPVIQLPNKIVVPRKKMPGNKQVKKPGLRLGLKRF